MNCIKGSFEPLRQRSCQERLLQERQKSARLLELSSAFAFQGTVSNCSSDNDIVSPLRSPKKRVKKVKMKMGAVTSSIEVESKLKSTKKKKKKSKDAEDVKAVIKPTSTTQQHKIAAEGKSHRYFRAMSEATPAAVVQIQRIARGWYQRLLYRIMWLQNQLDTSDERKRLALQRIEDRLHMHKYTYREKMERKAIASVTVTSRGTKEVQEMIVYLRKANKRLREKNQKLYDNIQAYKHNNMRLEEANRATDEYFGKLKEHVEQLEVINRKLNVSEKNYKATLENLEDGIAIREHYYLAEHRVKTCYAKAISTIVELADERGNEMGEEIFQLCLVGLEGYEAPTHKSSASKTLQKDDATDETANSNSDSDTDSDSDDSSIE
jgi:hypothetical protein